MRIDRVALLLGLSLASANSVRPDSNNVDFPWITCQQVKEAPLPGPLDLNLDEFRESSIQWA
jgi:hypothetical protein